MIVTEKIYNKLDVTFLEDIIIIYKDIKILSFKNVALPYHVIIIAAMPNIQQRRRRFEILFIIFTNSLSFPSPSLPLLHDYNAVRVRLCYNFYFNYISHYVV